jgi:DNA-binding transcriptional regulator YdaS (Cro superfamily)
MRVDEAVEFFGSQKALAEAIGISPSAVYQWGETIPPSRRQSVRMAMKERAEQLEQEAIILRAKAKEE